MTGSPMMAVLTIAGVVVGGMLLFFVVLKSEGLRNAINQTFRIPLILGLLAAGAAVSVLTLQNGLQGGLGLALALGGSLINLSDAARPRWLGWLMLLDGAGLLGVTCWSFVVQSPVFENELAHAIVAALMIVGSLWVTGASFYRLLRPRAATPSSTPSAETGTPA